MAQEIVKAGGEAFSFPGDVTDPDFPEAIVKATIQYISHINMLRLKYELISTRKWGKLNILVNNAGYTWDGVIHKMTDKQWEAMLKYVLCEYNYFIVAELASDLHIKIVAVTSALE